jgi:hypothetical protein
MFLADLFFRPFGAGQFADLTHGLRRGLHSCAAPQLSRRGFHESNSDWMPSTDPRLNNG